MFAISQVSAEGIDNTTLTSDEIIQEDLSTDDVSVDDIDDTASEILAGDGGEIQFQSFDVIQQKIDDADEGDTIYLSGYFKGSGTEISIEKSITIDGSDGPLGYSYIKAENLSRIFYVNAPGVVIKNLVLKDGSVPDGYAGGLIYFDEYCEDCYLIDCIMAYSSATYGGAVYTYESLTISDCQFINNTATEGGALYNDGDCYIFESYFEGNIAASDGGAAYSYYSDSMYVKDSMFNDNHAGGYGGGMCDGIAYNTSFYYNTADDYGGATYFCDVYDSIFLSNSGYWGGAMYGGCAENSAFANNTATERAGAIYLRDSVTIKNCEFENNTAELGGAVFSCTGSNTVSNCLFTTNEAGDDGGAVYNYESALTVSSSKFNYISANDDGGAIYTSFDAVSTTVTGSYFEGNYAGWWGGGMCRGDAYSTGFYLNSVSHNGGGMYGGSATDCLFSSNYPENTYDTEIHTTPGGGGSGNVPSQPLVSSLSLSQSGTYYGEKTVSARLVNARTGQPISGALITFRFSNGKVFSLSTGYNGVASFKVPFKPGTYKLTVSVHSSYNAKSVSKSVKIKKPKVKITAKRLKTQYDSNKAFKVKVVNSATKKGVKGIKLLLKVYTGKKVKKVRITTASNGVAKYVPKLKIGKHKVKISIVSKALAKGKARTSKIIVKKASTVSHAPDGLYVFKKAGKYYVAVSNKNTGNYIKGVKLAVKVYTGKKAKTYRVKTDSKGLAYIKTKSLKVGKHKVVVTFKGNSKYKKSTATGTLEITKKIPTYMGYHMMITRYMWGWASGRSINVYIKDIYGNELYKPITLTHSNGGTTTGYSGSFTPMPSGGYGDVVIRFAGDRTYRPCQYTIHFV